MALHKRAGLSAQQSDLINVEQLIAQYYSLQPQIKNPAQSVQFGTSGHRGSACRSSFNEQHILAITQAIVEVRRLNGITGPCLVGKDTHALSAPAFMTVIEVLIANGVDVIAQQDDGFTPTPAISNPSAFNAYVKFPSPQNKSTTCLAPAAAVTTKSRKACSLGTVGCKNAPDGYSTTRPSKFTVGVTVCATQRVFHVTRITPGNFSTAVLNSDEKYGTGEVIAISMPLSHTVTKHAPAPPHGNAAKCGISTLISSRNNGH